MLDQLLHTARGIEIAWRTVPQHSPLVGCSLADANLRVRMGASVIALIREQQMLANPTSSTRFAADDMVALLGEAEQVAAAERLSAGQPTQPGGQPAAVGLALSGPQGSEAGAA